MSDVFSEPHLNSESAGGETVPGSVEERRGEPRRIYGIITAKFKVNGKL